MIRAMKTILSALVVVLAVGPTFAVRAPLPAVSRMRRTSALGLRPMTTDFSHLRTALETRRPMSGRLLKTESSFPPRWDSREKGWVTSVKNQGNYGTCWAFATLASIETAVLKETRCAVTNDYSENHMATHDVGFCFGYDDGGNNQIAAALLTSWRDPLWESEDPYGHPYNLVDLPPCCHVQDIVWLPKRKNLFLDGEVYDVGPVEDNKEVDEAYKRAVIDYGAVSICYYHCDGNYNKQTGAHYVSDKNYNSFGLEGGHAVTLIGWDDNYAVENFKQDFRPPGKGAFLVKNSWGKGSSTTNGCTWISYYDEAIFGQIGAAYPKTEDRENFGRVYQYDPCGQVNTWNVYDTLEEEAQGGKENWCANVFTSMSTGVVSAVGFYAMEADTAYTLRIYRGCTSTPHSGELMLEQSGTIDRSGFVTLRLEREIPLSVPGEKFAVALRLECPSYAYPLPVECTFSDEYGPWCVCNANAGESFMSKDGVDWTDFRKYDPTGNFCIKAYTKFGSDGDFRKLINSWEPTADSVIVSIGGSCRFAVEPVAGETDVSYAWTVNGVDANCDSAMFDFIPLFAHHGNCVVECHVRSGASADVHAWTAVVKAELHVEGSGAAVENPDGSVERPFASIPEAVCAAIEGDTVLVGPGVYRGTLEGPSVQIEIRSTDGPEATVLDAEGAGRCYSGAQNMNTVISGFTLRNASVFGYLGGGVYAGVITNCVITNCVASVGGGAYNSALFDCRVIDCLADYYGGGICDSIAQDCVFESCSAYSGGGAGSYDYGCELYACRITACRSDDLGGGADYSYLCNSIVSECRAVSGGGVSYGEVENSLVTDNRSSRDGGGTYECTLYDCTVAGNSAERYGGGAYIQTVTAANSVIAANSSGRGQAYGNDAYGNGYWHMVCCLSDQDAKFVDAQHGDYHLTARSPCIDAGNDKYVLVERDLDGTNRVIGARVDIGCYEYCRTIPGWPVPDVARGASPEAEASAVSTAMAEAGFSAEKACILTTVAQYDAFSAWVEAKNLTLQALNASPTAFLSAALDSDQPLEISEQDLQIAEFTQSAATDGWEVKLSVSTYDPAKACSALLNAAVGIVGSDHVAGGYAADGIQTEASAASDGILIRVRPPDDKDAFFMRSVIR